MFCPDSIAQTQSPPPKSPHALAHAHVRIYTSPVRVRAGLTCLSTSTWTSRSASSSRGTSDRRLADGVGRGRERSGDDDLFGAQRKEGSPARAAESFLSQKYGLWLRFLPALLQF